MKRKIDKREDGAAKIKLCLFLAAVLLILAGDRIFGWSSWLKDSSNLAFLERQMEENLPLAILLYLAVTVIGSVVLALPGITFAVLAGLMFGPVLGTVCCVIGATLGAMLAFSAGRFFLKDSIRPRVMKNPYLKKWLFDETGKNQMLVLMVTRLVPLFPYNLQNFAYGITDIRFSAYSLGTLIFMLPGTAMYTIGTVGLTQTENRLLYIGISVVLAGLVLGVGKYLQKRYVGKE